MSELFEKKLSAYARLLVEAGCALKPGQDLFIRANIEAAPLVRLVTRHAYELGARLVTVRYSDEETERLTLEHASVQTLRCIPDWLAHLNNDMARAGAAILTLDSANPNGMSGIDPSKLAERAAALKHACKEFYDALDFGRMVWCIAGAASPKWAKTVFPDMNQEEALAALWEAIFTTVRVYDDSSDDAIERWRAHRASFTKRSSWLNEQHFDMLHYTSSNGTDFTVGLTTGSVFTGGGDTTQNGVSFFPNMPTEEIFTSPHKDRADGVVVASLPLVYHGNLIDKFWLRFENGRVCDFDAEQGADVLRSIITTDEGSHHLGELALVPYTSPIRETGLLFYSTLYDENASCHLALGQGFADCFTNGLAMNEETLYEAGINKSAQHVDFMIGTSDLRIEGIRADGTTTLIFDKGEWAF